MEDYDEDYVVAVVFSNWTLSKIFTFIEDYLDAEKSQVGFARIEKYRAKNGQIRESNRTIILMETVLFQEAINKGLDQRQPNLDFTISKYEISERHQPKSSQNSNIYLSFTKDLPHQDVEVQLKNRLDTFRRFGLIKHDYNLSIPLRSRETGEHKGFGYLNFTRDNLTTRALVRLLLHDSRLYNDEDPSHHYYLKASWVRSKK